MKSRPALLVALLGAMLLAGCGRRSDAGPVVVSAIGTTPALADSSQGPLAPPSRLLADSTAQGLVHFDASGQIEPGIAERWIVIDDGMSYIFRLRDAEWSDGRPVSAAEVVTILRRQIGARSRNPLLPFLSAIDEIVEMTPQVIEIRLKRPRPDLLKLFAQPELALFRTRPPGGSGPFRITETYRDGVMLRPAFDPARSPDDEAAEPGPEQNVRLIGERASRAITRFAKRDLGSGHGRYLCRLAAARNGRDRTGQSAARPRRRAFRTGDREPHRVPGGAGEPRRGRTLGGPPGNRQQLRSRLDRDRTAPARPARFSGRPDARLGRLRHGLDTRDRAGARLAHRA